MVYGRLDLTGWRVRNKNQELFQKCIPLHDAYAIIVGKMRQKQSERAAQQGFTIIEVVLFLAISGLLVLIALIGTGALINSVRFSDSARTTHAHVQQHYDEILNGFNPRSVGCGNSTPGASGCLYLGKLINFEIGTGSIKTYYVVSNEVPDLGDAEISEMSDDELIVKVKPTAVQCADCVVEEFTMPWAAEVYASKRISDGRSVNSYAILRSPRSSQLRSYTFEMPRALLDGQNSSQLQTALTAELSNPANIQKPTNFCMRSEGGADRPAMITVANGQGQNAIAVSFDIENEGEACNGS